MESLGHVPVTLGPRGLQHAGASLSLTVSQTSHEFTSIESVIPFGRLTLSPSIAQHVHLFFNRYLPKFKLLPHTLLGAGIANAKGKV